MAIDPSIALGVRPVQLENPLAQYSQVAQLQSEQNRNRLADLMFSEKRRQVDETNALNDLYKNALGPDGKIDRTKLFSGVAERGLGSKLPALQKTFTDQDKSAAELDKFKAETASKQVEAASKRADLAGQVFGFVRANPTLENAHFALDYLGQNGIYTPEQVAQYKQLTAADPTKIQALADQAFRGALSAKDQLAKIQTQNIGGSTLTQTVDPVTGKVATVNTVKNTQSPDNAATVAATIRGQNLTDARERDKIRQDDQHFQFTNNPTNQEQAAAAKERGKVSAETTVKAERNLPAVQDNVALALKNIDDLIGARDANGNLLSGSAPHPGFAQSVGAGIPGLKYVPGSGAADFNARLDQLKGGAFLQAFESLKGGGQITEVEGKKATDAITRMSTAQSEKEFVAAAQEFKGVLSKGLARAKASAGKPAGGNPASPSVSNWDSGASNKPSVSNW